MGVGRPVPPVVMPVPAFAGMTTERPNVRCDPIATPLSSVVGSLRPGCDHCRAFGHRPLVVAGAHEAEAIGLRALPGGAETFLGQFPGALRLAAA